MNSKILGGILLIIGTSIGGGLLALPVSTVSGGFISASIMLFFCWLIMTFAAFLILEVNLSLPEGANMLTMAKKTLGEPGKWLALISYILLLYSLLAAYMSGGSDVFQNLLQSAHINLPNWLSTLGFSILLGFFVIQGIAWVDYANRTMMSIKLLALILLIFAVAPHIKINLLEDGHPHKILAATMVIITSFGFAVIIPSMRVYLKSNIKHCRLALLIGSLIPLIAYIIWDAVVIGALQHTGKTGLLQMAHSGHPTSELMDSLSNSFHRDDIKIFARVFTSVCMVTSFFGVALSLSDFMADSLRIKKIGWGKLGLAAITFVPPILAVIYYPAIFITALSYAGIVCVILLVLLPGLMAYSSRYIKKRNLTYQVMGGKSILVIFILISLILLFMGALYQ